MDVARRLWILSRPQLTVYVLLLVLGGYGWAHWDRAMTIRGGWSLWGVLVGWWLLSAATLWLNAGLDQDDGEVLMGESITPPPHVELYGYLGLVAAVAICAAAEPLAGAAALASAVLAVLYSHPATVWKGHPLGGPLVNGVGYGLLTPMAGWAVVGVAINTRTALVWGLGMLGVVGCYFAAQAFQQTEDSERGYRTLVATHGPRRTILAARLCVGTALLGAVALGAVGWIPRGCLIIAPLAVWVDRWFAHWMLLPGGGSEADAREMARRLLITGLAGFALAGVAYVQHSTVGVPVAGLATAAGHPSDRPMLPPSSMRAWERAQERVARDARLMSRPTTPTSLNKRSGIDIAGFKVAHERGVAVIDVRTRAEFEGGHVPGAVNVPLGDFAPHDPRIKDLTKDAPVYTVSDAGTRSSRAADVLASAGFTAVNVEGGTAAWAAAGHRLER